MDHKAEAIRVSELAHDNADDENWARAEHQMQRANMHATLYLAEQQRIANIITWTTANGFAPSNKAQDEIVEGLGL